MADHVDGGLSPIQPRGTVALAALALTLLAVSPRFINLDKLSFYADEETTALPALALVEGLGPRFPSGMEYRRALPLTWLNAASARAFGKRNDLSYRLPVAVLGALTIPLLFLLGRNIVGTSAAAAAAALLALSEWHLVFSRQARMYAPMLFFFIAAAYAIWLWAERGRTKDLLVAIVLFALTVTMHDIGVFALAFALIPMALGRRSRVPTAVTIGVTASLAAAALSYRRFFVGAPYRWFPRPPEPSGAGAGWTVPWFSQWVAGLTTVDFVLAAGGAALGAWAAALARSADSSAGSGFRVTARLTTAMLAGALAGLGQLYGATLAAVIFLFLQPGSRRDLAKIRAPVALLALLGTARATALLLANGPGAGLRQVLAFPFPYAGLLAIQFPTLVVLFSVICLWLALRSPAEEEYRLRACALFVLASVGVLGVASKLWVIRYMLPAYPFVLLVVAAGLQRAIARLGRNVRGWSRWSAAAVLIIVAISGVLGGHGIPQAVRTVTLEHGEPVNEIVHMYPFRPDHRAAGEFVRRARAPADVVIAEDPLQQQWYAGRADYWLRSYADSRAYLFTAEDGALRDIYVRSALITERAALDSLAANIEGRLWLITSGETYPGRSYFLDDTQLRWLDSIQAVRAPVFSAGDGVTEVYCLNCLPGALE